ncbi:cytochrome c family protein [Sphingomonas sp. RG327]|jgi:cytochrome c|uniref:Cytochrome c family protein n=1 Tax=Sphingomonas anseongensis TaxID=2908207 RepID=A0ABT0RFK1_9SPHN|nr:cytochrome c family protein [Sphingomonas anseongensis]MCL6679014.1 cytochrome c family protein [Sphingomonas anseongensis]
MDDRFNTIAGWVLFAGIIALGGSIVAGEAFHSERPEKMGYPIEGVVEEGAGGAAAEEPIAFYLAKADPAKGEQVFKKCAACHNADKGGANQLGPNLWGVLGEPIGKGRGFPFTDALASKGGNWDWDNLSEWLKSPKSFAPGTKMTFAGLSKPEDRADVIAFLNQHSDAPKPLPAAPAAAAGSPAAGGDAAKPAAAAPGDVPGQKGTKEPVLNNTAADPKGNGEAAPQK